ncbi:angiomotin-like [Panicum virgatum]|uniref:angiomotin-like n=1 Tax=Panicum virgatum TaxID=38727 RepID=UPI0019D632EB|nr:angiomotin-like [Panicum virgatum]
MVDITDKSVVCEENQIPVPEDKLKEEQKMEFEELVEKFKRECLKSYSINRSGEVIKKFDLPTFQPLTEAQHENKMMDAVGQAVAQAFIKSATVMGNTVHNAVVKTLAEGVEEAATSFPAGVVLPAPAIPAAAFVAAAAFPARVFVPTPDVPAAAYVAAGAFPARAFFPAIAFLAAAAIPAPTDVPAPAFFPAPD